MEKGTKVSFRVLWEEEKKKKNMSFGKN